MAHAILMLRNVDQFLSMFHKVDISNSVIVKILQMLLFVMELIETWSEHIIDPTEDSIKSGVKFSIILVSSTSIGTGILDLYNE